MTTTRRALALLTLTLAVLVTATLPANAAFDDPAPAVTATVGTLTVQPPTQVEAKGLCTTTTDPATGAVTTTVQAKIEWWRSTSPGVTGYVVTAHLNNGASYVMARTDATADEVFDSADASHLQYQPRFTITTLTSYGWTAVSVRSGVLTC
ncbi:hypothetical protein [Geodermatophilus sp. CPCC 205761]|uniref:hypothetical protein n=1 Tax=Geodermatophilus sp. CPCC 205761 TaxID=2936597 RepID=UPI003EF0558C